jgi:uncharacterized protein YidB (DUF937 family)
MSDISKMLGGLFGGGEKGNVLQSLLAQFGGGQGQGFDIGGLLDKFKGSGLGQKVDSWVGTGGNEKLSGAEVEQALGSDTVDRIAQQSGVPKQNVQNDLAETIPQLVDKVTPEGKVPDRGGLQDMIGKFLGK